MTRLWLEKLIDERSTTDRDKLIPRSH